MITLPNLAHKKSFKDLNKGPSDVTFEVLPLFASLVSKSEEDTAGSQRTSIAVTLSLWFIVKIIPNLLIFLCGNTA